MTKKNILWWRFVTVECGALFTFGCVKLQRRLCDKVSLKVIYKCVYYCELHIVQFGGSVSLARNLILAFKNVAQTHIVSGSLPVLPTN